MNCNGTLYWLKDNQVHWRNFYNGKKKGYSIYFARIPSESFEVFQGKSLKITIEEILLYI